MSRQYEVVIVGAGLFGAVCAYELSKSGFRCLVLEKRTYLGGNCYTELRDGITVHTFGAHIFHTYDKGIWAWINQFACFNHYRHRLKVNYNGRIFSFPPNLSTFYQLLGHSTPQAVQRHLEEFQLNNVHPRSLRDWVLGQLGPEFYEIFIKGYTTKQWGKCPSKLPVSIIRRVPIRLTYDDDYFADPYQGVPTGGYTPIFEKLLTNVELALNTDYLSNRSYYDSLARRILYTGPIDQFFEHQFGPLEYRSLHFEHQRVPMPDFQGIAVMNYTSEAVPYTRIIEHKHLEFGQQPVSWVTKEYPTPCTNGLEPMYPLRDRRNLGILNQYRKLSRNPKYHRFYFGGRLADYQYYDMDQVIASALRKATSIKRDLLS